MSPFIKIFKRRAVALLALLVVAPLIARIAVSSDMDLPASLLAKSVVNTLPASSDNSATPPVVTSLQREITRLSTRSGPPGSHLRSVSLTPLVPLHKSIWDRLSSGLTLTSQQHPDIDRQLRFMQEGIYSLQSNLARARPYLHFILEEIERAGLPADLALLPLVESAFDPLAKSNQQALGLWQFIAATARSYGLSNNKWFDGRRDVIASTRAAIRYLDYLHRTFDGDWLLAIAAYNTGPGNVRAAIKRATKKGSATDFWSLRLAKETKNYVPRLIAVSKLIANPDHYDLTLPTIANRKYFETISLDTQISLQQASELAGVSHKSLVSLNSGLITDKTPPDGPHVLNVPTSSLKKLLDALASQQRQRLTESATTKSRDSTVPAEQMDQQSRSVKAGAIAPDVTSANDTFKPFKTYHYKSHIVEPGDNLWDLSRKIGTSVNTLTEWNQSAMESGHLKIGARVHVAFTDIETDKTPVPRLFNYLVSDGDTLPAIADKFNSKISTLKKWNPALWTKNHVQAGQSLRIPMD